MSFQHLIPAYSVITRDCQVLYTELMSARNIATMSVNLVQSCLKLTEFFESVHQFQNTFFRCVLCSYLYNVTAYA